MSEYQMQGRKRQEDVTDAFPVWIWMHNGGGILDD
jgi:hypothetical protein